MVMSATDRTLHVWLISPYHSGSHRVWAEGYARRSRHRITLLTMAGRFWKWRMQGGALELAVQARQQLVDGAAPDVILATDMLNVPAWLGLVRTLLPPAVPLVLYMHENQLTYPWRPGEKPDFTYAMINWLSQVAADRVLFNSEYQRSGWFEELPRLLKHFPDYNRLELVDSVHARSAVLPVGIEVGTDNVGPAGAGSEPSGSVPLILWNQRWEYDKRPDRFFALLYRLQHAGAAFELAVAGENFRNVPAEFEEARARLADRIVHWGYIESAAAYRTLLQRADLVISTAMHEFFGISVLEAISAGAFPLLPADLSYPELIPADLHPACLYTDEDDLFAKALHRVTHPRPAPPSLRAHIATRFDWNVVAGQYDRLLVDTVSGQQDLSDGRIRTAEEQYEPPPGPHMGTTDNSIDHQPPSVGV